MIFHSVIHCCLMHNDYAPSSINSGPQARSEHCESPWAQVSRTWVNSAPSMHTQPVGNNNGLNESREWVGPNQYLSQSAPQAAESSTSLKHTLEIPGSSQWSQGSSANCASAAQAQPHSLKV